MTTVFPDVAAVEAYLRGLHDRICAGLEQADGRAKFASDVWERSGGGGGDTRVLSDGALFERAGVAFSLVHGKQLPPSASKSRPELAGRGWRAMGVSLVLHPHNPHVPTVHMNVRFFIAEVPSHSNGRGGTDAAPGLDRGAGQRSDQAHPAPIWWFGGGFDLTPYYAEEEDVIHWHRTARDAVGAEHYPRLKKWCDEYFYLPHRQEPRGVGGLFFDDWSEGGFADSFALTQSVGNHFLPAYLPIVKRRRDTAYGEHERDFQLYRRGRYVEFNLVHDRGTLFGLQSGGRTESILMSMPPEVRWRYNWQPATGTPEAELYEKFLKTRDWL